MLGRHRLMDGFEAVSYVGGEGEQRKMGHGKSGKGSGTPSVSGRAGGMGKGSRRMSLSGDFEQGISSRGQRS